jgi:hypothetical protein
LPEVLKRVLGEDFILMDQNGLISTEEDILEATNYTKPYCEWCPKDTGSGRSTGDGATGKEGIPQDDS